VKSTRVAPLFLFVLLAAGAGAALDALLNLGDTFRGAISHGDDVDVIEFDAVANTVLTVTAKADKKQLLLPSLEVIDLTTDISLATEASGKKKTAVKKLILPSTGRYRVCISGHQATTGSYKVKTKGKITKAVKKTLAIEESVAADASFSIVFDASPAMKLSARIGKNKKSDLEGPGEAPIFLTGFFSEKNDKIIIKNVELPELGTYTLTVDNAGAIGAMKGKLSLKPPKIPKSAVDEPSEQ